MSIAPTQTESKTMTAVSMRSAREEAAGAVLVTTVPPEETEALSVLPAGGLGCGVALPFGAVVVFGAVVAFVTGAFTVGALEVAELSGGGAASSFSSRVTAIL